jgi:hypothetical protein
MMRKHLSEAENKDIDEKAKYYFDILEKSVIAQDK